MNCTFAHLETGGMAVIRQTGSDLLFGTVINGETKFGPLEGLKMSLKDILETFPDLEGLELREAKKTACKRFKKKFFELRTHKQRIEYLKEDLGKHGYKMIMYQIPGFRTQKCQ